MLTLPSEPSEISYQGRSFQSILPDPPLQVFNEVLWSSYSLSWSPGVHEIRHGLPGSETALEEIMCRVLGNLVQEGHVAKLADDLYCGAETLDALLATWQRVLQALDRCNLRLSVAKTVI